MIDCVVLHDDDVGTAVADRLRPLLPAARTKRVDPWLPAHRLAELAGSAELLVFAWSRPVRRLETAVDEVAIRHRATLVPVVQEDLVLRVGPVLGPADEATAACYYGRRAQHGAPRVPMERMFQHLDDRPTGAVAAHLPSTSAYAAALVAGIAGRLAAGTGEDGRRIVFLEPLAGRTVDARLVGVHGNARSRPPYGEADRTWLGLRDVVRTAMRTPQVAAVGNGKVADPWP